VRCDHYTRRDFELTDFTLTMSFLACLVSALAPVCVYLSSAEQRITQVPLPPVWRSIGFLLTAVGLFLWTTTVSTPAALFASASMWATAYAVLPYISWVKLPASEE
jgi:hypothetical protein